MIRSPYIVVAGYKTGILTEAIFNSAYAGTVIQPIVDALVYIVYGRDSNGNLVPLKLQSDGSLV